MFLVLRGFNLVASIFRAYSYIVFKALIRCKGRDVIALGFESHFLLSVLLKVVFKPKCTGKLIYIILNGG